MDTTTLVLAVAAVALLLFALRRGPDVAVDGLLAAWQTLRRNLVLLILGFVLAGLVPGAPYATFLLVASLYQAGASLGAVVGFVSAWALWSVSRLPVEMALVDPRPALIRYGVTFIVPPLAGMLAEMLDRFV